MNNRRYLKKLITGLSVHQQYVCLALESFRYALSVRLSIEGKDTEYDVTQSHIFLGYKPVVICLFSSGNKQIEGLSRKSVVLRFYPAGEAGNLHTSESVAYLKLKRCNEQPAELPGVLYEAERGHHSFIKSFYQLVNNQLERFRKTGTSNINLPGNLRDQVRIAYAIPRIISLITVSCDNLINIFPTDLHGPIGKGYYASSLRMGGKANEQVNRCGRVVISEIESTYYRHVYALGKNHMKEMQTPDQFDYLSSRRSAVFDHPLPIGILRYRELEVISSCAAGIHRIYFYKTVHEVVINELGETLAHIDQYYAQWRLDHGLPTNLLIR